MSGESRLELSGATRIHHLVQRAIGRLVAPLWLPIAAVVLRFFCGHRIENRPSVQEEFRRLRADTRSPLLICANHLTLVDSFVIAHALAPAWRYAIDFDALPWNTPEETNFANTPLHRALAYLAKCIPIRRGGSREDIANVLNRVVYLLDRGEVALLFPEGGRSRSGRISSEGAGWGVGRIVGAVPGCRVLCVYLRGRSQVTWSDRPVKGDRIYVDLACIEPKSDLRGARRTRDLAQQIIKQLVHMEESYFDGRQ